MKTVIVLLCCFFIDVVWTQTTDVDDDGCSNDRDRAILQNL